MIERSIRFTYAEYIIEIEFPVDPSASVDILIHILHDRVTSERNRIEEIHQNIRPRSGKCIQIDTLLDLGIISIRTHSFCIVHDDDSCSILRFRRINACERHKFFHLRNILTTDDKHLFSGMRIYLLSG